MKKLILIVLVLVAVGVGAVVYTMRRNQPEPTVTTQQLSRGDIVDTVGATGTLEAVETVDVGTQVSGVVQQLFADFNSIVRKGQIIAKLDPSLIQTQIEQQTANVISAEADLERLKVALADAQQKLDRAKAMSERSLIPTDRARDGRSQRQVCRSANPIVGSGPDAGARAAQQPEGQPGLHDDRRADRRHRDLAQRRSGTDGRLEHERADAVRHRG